MAMSGWLAHRGGAAVVFGRPRAIRWEVGVVRDEVAEAVDAVLAEAARVGMAPESVR